MWIKLRIFAEGRYFISETHDPAMGVGAEGRNIKIFGAYHITGADAASDDSCSGTKSSGIRTLSPAQTKLHDAAAPGCITDSGCLGGDQGLVVDQVQNSCFNQLRLHNGSYHFYQWFHRKYHTALRDRIYVAGKMKTCQIIQKVFGKTAKSPEIVNIIIIKMQTFDVINDLIQAGTDSVAAVVRILAVKQIKYHSLIGVIFKISLHHCQFIKISQKCKIAIIHESPSFLEKILHLL